MTMATHKVALITGASGDLGRAICEKLADDGYAIWAHYLSNRRSAEELRSGLLARDVPCELCCFDVADAVSVQQVLPGMLAVAPVHSLVVNAGMVRIQPVAFQTSETMSEIIDTNLKGLFNVLQPVVRGMIKQRAGIITVVSSMAAVRGLASHSSYAASKAGLLGAVQSLARELGGYGIRVNAVLPGLIATKMNDGRDLSGILAQIPLARSGCATDVADAVSFLSSSRASYITGAELAVTGGLHC